MPRWLYLLVILLVLVASVEFGIGGALDIAKNPRAGLAGFMAMLFGFYLVKLIVIERRRRGG
jgi:hypothetical protein